MDRFLPTHLGRLDSRVQRLDPRTRLILVLGFVIVVVSTPPTRLAAFVAYAGLLSWATAGAGVPVTSVLWRSAAVLPFSVLAASWLPFMHGAPAVELWGGAVRLSVSGLWLFAGVVMKSLLGAGAAVLLALTTPLPQLAAALRKLGAPVILVDTLTLTYRYLFVLVEEAGRLRRAAAARGYRPRWLGQALLIGRLVGQLFLRSYERAERVHGAMVQRGYRGFMPTAHELAWGVSDVVALAVVLPTLAAVRTWLR
ncbi:MAG: cobalt ECF transporter T component CbiQ [Planctomycetaceae bacterium]|nr:cobalt ECF transporter T component CbiQ [Planctomycetaceae bacterium]